MRIVRACRRWRVLRFDGLKVQALDGAITVDGGEEQGAGHAERDCVNSTTASCVHG